jgi:hypothetical protein
MENNKDKATDKEVSAEAAIERGKAAIKADEQINKKDLDDPKVKAEKEKDAEQWRNEG